MASVGRLLAGVAAELRGLRAAAPLLRWPFWLAWGLPFCTGLLAALPGDWQVPVQAQVLLALGLAGVFSGRVAGYVRRLRWVASPDSPDVTHSLPPLLTLLTLPPYFVAMAVLFWQTGQRFPGVLPAAGP